jgi:hypothetical protein
MASETKMTAGMSAPVSPAAPAKPGPTADVEDPESASEKSNPHIGSLPDDLLAQVLACLPQGER